VVVFALLAAELADGRDAEGNDGQRGIDLQGCEGFVREGGAHIGEAGQAHVRLVRAELAHGIVIGDARKGRGEGNAGGFEGSGQKVLDDAEDGLLAGEAHLEIDLCELKLAVGA
jgi:hypothetical protein